MTSAAPRGRRVRLQLALQKVGTMELAPAQPLPWRQLADCVYELPTDFRRGMRVPLRMVADEPLVYRWTAGALEHLIELCELQGAHEYVLALPNVHEQHLERCGRVFSALYPEGTIIPSEVGADINCGFRLLTTPLRADELEPALTPLMDALQRHVPVGPGRSGAFPLSALELHHLMAEGCSYLVREKGVGSEDDLLTTEFAGHFHDGHAEHLSHAALTLGLAQLGTLGAGAGHFVEVGVVDEVEDEVAASKMQLHPGTVTLLLHSSSLGVGAKTAEEMEALARESGPRGRIATLPLASPEGIRAYRAIRAAANFGWANRHVLAHKVRAAFEEVFATPAQTSLRGAFDSAANYVSLERTNGEIACVHWHRATSAHGSDEADAVPQAFRDLGQPLLIPGSMGRSAYVLLAEELAPELSRASAPHGTGQHFSASEVHRRYPPELLAQRLAEQGVILRSPHVPLAGLRPPELYRDAEEVVSILVRAGVARRVARLRPRGLLRG